MQYKHSKDIAWVADGPLSRRFRVSATHAQAIRISQSPPSNTNDKVSDGQRIQSINNELQLYLIEYEGVPLTVTK